MTEQPTTQKNAKTKFLVRNLVRGFLWLGILIALFIVANRTLGDSYFIWLEPIYEKPLAVFSIFLASEVLIGIIPPELFMIWAAREQVLADFVGNVFLLTLISYAAGVVGHWIGSHLSQSKFYRLMKRNFFGKYEKYFHEFGGFIIVVAALTPLPFSGIAMLMGSMNYPLKKYLLFSLFRFPRFAVYGFFIWEASLL